MLDFCRSRILSLGVVWASPPAFHCPVFPPPRRRQRMVPVYSAFGVHGYNFVAHLHPTLCAADCGHSPTSSSDRDFDSAEGVLRARQSCRGKRCYLAQALWHGVQFGYHRPFHLRECSRRGCRTKGLSHNAYRIRLANGPVFLCCQVVGCILCHGAGGCHSAGGCGRSPANPTGPCGALDRAATPSPWPLGRRPTD